MRLGVAEALVAGERVAGDVEVDPDSGLVTGVGLPGPGSGLALPGLVDLQVNGVAGTDLRTCGPDGYAAAAALLAAGGATAVQPTLHSQAVEDHERSLNVVAEVLADPPPGCRFLPAHLEGPFLSPRFAGAHDPAHLMDPDPQVLDRLLAAGPVGFMTVAPELPGAPELIARLVGRGVVVSLGHTDADAATVRSAVAAGARHLTHCWNAHRRLLARDPGPAGVALGGDGLVVGVVADLVHVDAEVLAMTARLAAGRLAATTDSVAVARLADGTLAGGVARPVDCLANLVGVGMDLAGASDACGGAQRRLLGSDAVLVRPGDPADLVVLDDALEPVRTLVGGAEVWRR